MKKLKFLAIILCLFLMIPAVNALTVEQVREEILASDIVLDMSGNHSSNYWYDVEQILNQRIHNINNHSYVNVKTCTYDACNITIHYYDYDGANAEILDVNNVPIKKYGIVYNNDDIIENHVGDTLEVDNSYKLLDEEFNEVDSNLNNIYVQGATEEDNEVTIVDETNEHSVTFNEPGYYEVNLNVQDAEHEFYYSHVAVLTDAQELIDSKLSNMNTFKSDRSDYDPEYYDTIQALEQNLKKKVLSEHAYINIGESHTTRVGETNKYNVDFTLQLRNKTLNFKKDNLEVEEVGINFANNLYSIKMNLDTTYQINYTLYSESVTWKSSDPAVATVNNSGLITAVGSGATLITATTSDGITKDLIVMVQDDGTIHNRLNNIANSIGGTDHKIHVAAVKGVGDVLYDEIDGAIYEAVEKATDDIGIIVDIVEVDEENYASAKFRLGYSYSFQFGEDDFRYVEYCKTSEWSNGYDCASDVITLTVVFADDEPGFNENLKTTAANLANNFNFNKTYTSNTNATIAGFLSDSDDSYYYLFYKNANLNESIPNNDGFVVRPYYRMGGPYLSAFMKTGDALIEKDGVIYAVKTANQETHEGLDIRAILKVKRPQGNETEIDAITNAVRRIVNDNTITMRVYKNDEEAADPVLGSAYAIVLRREGNEEQDIPYLEMYISTYVEFVDEEPVVVVPQNTIIEAINVTGIVAPVEGEHPITEGIQITTPGITLKEVKWFEESSGRELTSEDTFIVNEKYILRFTFDLLNGYTIPNEPDLNGNPRQAKEDWVGCPGDEICTEDLDFRLYYGSKSAAPVAITAVPHIDIRNDNNDALILDIAYDQNATYLEVYRNTASTGTFKKVATVNEGYYRDNTVITGTTYYYKVRVCNTVNCSKYSNVASLKTMPKKVEDFAVSSVGTNNVKLAWTKANYTGYEIARSNSETGTYKVIATITNNATITYNNTGLNANTTYYYKIRAYKTVGKTKLYSDYSNVISAKTGPAVPKLEVLNNSYNSLIIKIGTSTGATIYELYRSTNKTDYTKIYETTDTLEYKDTNLDTGRTYYYKVRACNELCSSYSTVIEKKTVIKVPNLTASVNENKRIVLDIEAIEGANGYEVQRSTYKNKNFKVIGTTENSTYIDEVGLNTTYYYKVRAYSIVDENKVYSGYSAVKSAKVTLSAPAFALSKTDINNIKIDITKVTGAVGYEIARSTYKNKNFKVIATTENLEYSELVNLNTTYYYKVRSFILVNGKKAYSGYSSVKSIKASLSTPTYTLARANVNEVTLTMNEVVGSEGFEIWRSTNSRRGYSLVGTVTEPIFKQEISLNTTYYYKVRAYKLVNEKKNYSSYSSVKSTKATLGVPAYTLTRENVNEITIGITEVANANGYEIWRSTNSRRGFYLVGTVTEPTFKQEISLNTTYYYKVRAYKLVGEKKNYSAYSSVKSTKATLGVPTYTLTKENVNEVTIGITEVANANGYEIQRSTYKNKNFKTIATVTENTYKEEISLNTTYYYRVRAYKLVGEKKNYSSYSSVKSTKATLGVPVINTTSLALNKIKLELTEVANADGYEIYRSTNPNKNFALIGTDLSLDQELSLNTNYYYKVRAYKLVGEKKNYGSYSSVKTVKLNLGVPTFTLTGEEQQVEVKIDELAYAEGYEIWRSTSSKGTFTKVGETNELTFNDSASANKTYYYKLRSFTTFNNKKIYSGYSSIKNVRTK